MQCPSDHKKYVNMIKNFGTHWTRAVAFGNKETLRAVFSNDQVRSSSISSSRFLMNLVNVGDASGTARQRLLIVETARQRLEAD